MTSVRVRAKAAGTVGLVGGLLAGILLVGIVTAGTRSGSNPASVAGMSLRAGAGPTQSPRVASGPVPLPTPPATTERDSVGSAESQLNGSSGGASAILAGARPDQAISANGRWVAFVSTAPSLGAGPTHPLLFIHDRQAGTTTPIPWIGGAAFPAGISAAEPTISADGGVVAFTVIAVPNVPLGGVSSGSSTPTPFVVAWDRATNTTSLVSVDPSNKPLPAWQPSISADGRYVAYTTWLAQPTATPTATPPPTAIPDTTAPLLSDLVADPSCFSSAGTATVAVTASDPDDPVASVSITVYPPSASSFSQPMIEGGGGTWTYVISGSTSWSNGFIDYTVTATDSHGNSTSAFSTHDETGHNYLTFAPNGCIV